MDVCCNIEPVLEAQTYQAISLLYAFLGCVGKMKLYIFIYIYYSNCTKPRYAELREHLVETNVGERGQAEQWHLALPSVTEAKMNNVSQGKAITVVL